MAVLYVAFLITLAISLTLVVVACILASTMEHHHSPPEVAEAWVRSMGYKLLSFAPADAATRNCFGNGCFDIAVSDARGAVRIGVLVVTESLVIPGAEVRQIYWDDERAFGFPVLSSERSP